MKKNYSSGIIDNLVLIFSVFLISFLWIRYREHNTFLILLYSSLITFFICSTIHFISRKRQKKQEINKKEAIFLEKISDFLIFSKKTEVLKIFEQCLKSKNVEYKKQSDFLFFNSYALRPIYNKQTADDCDIIETIKKSKTQKQAFDYIIITAKNFSSEAKTISQKSSTKIILMDEKQTYLTFFKQYKFNFEQEKQSKKLSFKEKLSQLSLVAFNRQRFKGYLYSALVLFVGSYFMRYNLYYISFATILLLLAIFSYFNKPFNKPEKNLFEPTKKE